MSAGLTWARNEFDDQALSMKELSETVLKLKTQGPPLKAVKISRLTLLSIPLAPMQESVSTFYGIPIQIDDSLGLWELKEVYA